MPELPEVEAARRLAERHCLNKAIVDVEAVIDDKVFELSPAEICSALINRKFEAVNRKGKYFWLHLSGRGPDVLLHFGMAGYLSIQGQGAAKYVRIKDCTEWPPKYTKLELKFDDGTALAFADARRFGRIKLQEDPESLEPLCKLGPDAYTELPSCTDFQVLLSQQRRPLKAALLDQSFVSGIGNWVADEVLYQAKLFPEQPCYDVSEGQAQLLHDTIQHVLEVSIAVDSEASRLPPEWLFHFRWSGKATTADFHGNVVQFLKVGGRTTAYAPALQVKAATVTAGGVTKGKGSGSGRTRKKPKGPATAAEEQEGALHNDQAMMQPVVSSVVMTTGNKPKAKPLAKKLQAAAGRGKRTRMGRPAGDEEKAVQKTVPADRMLSDAGKTVNAADYACNLVGSAINVAPNIENALPPKARRTRQSARAHGI